MSNALGAPWCDLPHYYGPWQSVYTLFRRWEQAGIFGRMLNVLSADPDDESVMIDASIIRVHQHGADAKRGAPRQDSIGFFYLNHDRQLIFEDFASYSQDFV